MTEVDHLLAKIDAFLAENPGMSDRSLSDRATTSVDTIRNIRRSHLLPKERNLSSLASFLGMSVDDLLGRTPASHGGPLAPPRFARNEAVPADLGDVRRTFRQMPSSLPVYGTALGHNARFDDNGAADIEVTIIEQTDVVLRIARPPALMNNPDAYGFYVQGDSMAPAHKPGALRIADPRAPIRITDDVVVQLRAPIDDGEEVVTVLIKTLVKRTASFIELEQLNPPARFRVERESIAAIHRVMELDELLRG